MAQGKKLWLRCVVAYTVAGSASAIMVGLGLGQIGHWLGGENHIGTKLYLVSLLSLLFAAREWGWIDFRLPELRRQSEKAWVHHFGFVMGAGMWGFHIGLGFATRVNFGGFWVLAALAVVLASPLYGGALMLLYWVGRAVPVWFGPGVVRSIGDAGDLPTTVLRSRPVYHRLAGLVLAWASGATMLAALLIWQSSPLGLIVRH